MKPISQKTLRDAEWKPIYSYSSPTAKFVTFGSDAVPGVTITHENKPPTAKTRTYYTVHGKRVDGPIQAVRDYNAKNKQANGGRSVADGVEPAGPA